MNIGQTVQKLHHFFDIQDGRTNLEFCHGYQWTRIELPTRSREQLCWHHSINNWSTILVGGYSVGQNEVWTMSLFYFDNICPVFYTADVFCVLWTLTCLHKNRHVSRCIISLYLIEYDTCIWLCVVRVFTLLQGQLVNEAVCSFVRYFVFIAIFTKPWCIFIYIFKES